MKKILAFSLILALLSAAALAQSRPANRSLDNRLRRNTVSVRLVRPETLQLRKQLFRYEVIRRRVYQDEIVTPYERRKLIKARRQAKRSAEAEKGRKRFI